MVYYFLKPCFIFFPLFVAPSAGVCSCLWFAKKWCEPLAKSAVSVILNTIISHETFIFVFWSVKHTVCALKWQLIKYYTMKCVESEQTPFFCSRMCCWVSKYRVGLILASEVSVQKLILFEKKEFWKVIMKDCIWSSKRYQLLREYNTLSCLSLQLFSMLGSTWKTALWPHTRHCF